MIGQSAVLAPI